MGKVLALILCLLTLTRPLSAAEYSKPAGAPELFLPDYGVTISVFAITTPVGSGLAVGEKTASGKFNVCGTCGLYVIDLGSEVAFKGSPAKYIEGQIPDINSILARVYPRKSAPAPGNTAVDQVNFSLYQSFGLGLVNGVPVLSAK